MIANIPPDQCFALGLDPSDFDAEIGLSPCALLVASLGPATGQDRWLTALSTATTLARAQATESEIHASLVTEVDLSPALAQALTAALTEALDIARAAGRAQLRSRLWDVASGAIKATPQELALAQAAAKQYLAWQGGVDAEALSKAIREVEAGHAKRRGGG